MAGFRRVMIVAALAGWFVFGLAAPASADHDRSYFSGWGHTEEEATAAARASMATYEQQQGIDCVEEYTYTQWDWEYEWWEAVLVADCTPGDTIQTRYFSGWGHTQEEATAAARASMAAYERQQGVDCVEKSVWTEWDWEHDWWEAHLRAECDFG